MTVSQRLHLGMALGALVAILWLLSQAGSALVPFAVGTLLAYLLAPLVRRISARLSYGDRHPGAARATVVLVIYVVIIGGFVAFGIALLPGLFNQVGLLIEHGPEYLRAARLAMEGYYQTYFGQIPPELQGIVNDQIDKLAARSGDVVQTALQSTIGIVTQTFSTVIAYLVIPVWIFYFLKDQPRIIAWFHGLFPPEYRDDVTACISIAHRTLQAYVRGQLILGLFIGVATYIGLRLMGIPLATPLAVVAGILELLPLIGPFLTAVVALTVTLATAAGVKVLWVLGFFVVLQWAENHLLVPRIQGSAVQLHPLVIVFLLVVFGELFGLLGALVAVPTAAVARDLFVYVYRRIGEVDSPQQPPLIIVEPASGSDEGAREDRRTEPGDIPEGRSLR